jgi:hypothetical protein
LNEIISVDTVDDDVTNTEVLVTGVTLIVWDGRLVNRPVVEWRIVNWVLELDEIVSINSIDDDVTDTEVLMTGITLIVRNGWLVDAPVVVWWVIDWVS